MIGRSLTLKLAILPAVALSGLILNVGYTATNLTLNNERISVLEQRNYPVLEASDAVIFQLTRLPSIFQGAVASGDMDALNESKAVLGQIESHLNRLEELVSDNPAQASQLREWRRSIDGYFENAFSASKGLVSGEADFSSLSDQIGRMATDLETTQGLSTGFRADRYGDFTSLLEETRLSNEKTTEIGLIVSIVISLIVLLGALLIIISIMRNVRGVIGSLRDIARGEGDLTRRVDVRANDEIGEMTRLFNSFLDKLQQTLSKVVGASEPLFAASSQLYKLTQASESNAKSQQGRTRSISADIESMTTTIEDVASRSKQASNEAAEVSRQAEVARSSINNLSEGITDLGNGVKQAVTAMSELEHESQQVGSVLTVIQGIAEQTNLLALNAAIEAARAGEQGRGFAVVADEVRKLAQKTASSTSEIQQIIERLQNSADKALEIMTINGEKATSSVTHSEQATTLLTDIAAAVANIDQLNARIADSTQDQIGLSSSIREDIQVLQGDAQATAEGAESTARLGEQLVETGNELRSATSQFKI